MHTFSIYPWAIMASLWRHRALVGALIVREVAARYRGSVMGLFWSFLHPALMLAVYTFVFSQVFKSRWPGDCDSHCQFALVLFSGLIVYNLFAECVNRAPALIPSHINYLKKVVFPLEVLPWVLVGSALLHCLVSLIVLLAAYTAAVGMPPVSVLWLPAILLPLVLFTVGLSWLLAALGVYLRDMAQMIGILTTILMFASPIFYPLSALPPEFQPLLQLNPLTPVIEQARNALIWGMAPPLPQLASGLEVALLALWLGFAGFQKTRRGFADVL